MPQGLYNCSDATPYGDVRGPCGIAEMSEAPVADCRQLGNGRNTVSRVLFRKRELTEFSVSSAKNSVSSLLHTIIG